MYRRLNVHWPAGRLDGVVVATSFVDRLLGLRRRGIAALIIDAPSVHTFGMRSPIVVVETTLFGVVTGVHCVAPRRIHRRSNGGPLLEIRAGMATPDVGDRLTLLPCPSDVVSCPVGPLDISASNFHSWQGRTTTAHLTCVEAEDAAREEKGR